MARKKQKTTDNKPTNRTTRWRSEWQELQQYWQSMAQRAGTLTAAERLYWILGIAFTAWLVWHFWLLLFILALFFIVPHRDTRTDEQRAHDNWVNHWKDRD